MEFLLRQQQVAAAYARNTLRELLDAADGADASRTKAASNAVAALLRQGQAVEDVEPGPSRGDPADELRREYRLSMKRVRTAARALVAALESGNMAQIAAARAAARVLLGLRKP